MFCIYICQFGSYFRDGEGYFLQTADTKGSHKDKELRKFEIIKQTGKPMLYDAVENFDGKYYFLLNPGRYWKKKLT